MTQYIVQHRRGNPEEWEQYDGIPYDCEIVMECYDDGSRNIKIGNGIDKFSDLPYVAKDASNIDQSYVDEQVQVLLDEIETKADKAVTLAGYNIEDAYTKTEIDNAFSELGAGVKYVEYISSGGSDFITVDIANNHIIKIDGYRHVTITAPSNLSNFSTWDCYFYIAFRKADSVSLILPENIRITGDRPSCALPGDLWEISINNYGGAVCMIHRYQSSLG